jgi:hypothetical protein
LCDVLFLSSHNSFRAADVLNRQLTSWLDEVATSDNALDGMPFTPPIPGCRAIVAPCVIKFPLIVIRTTPVMLDTTTLVQPPPGPTRVLIPPQCLSFILHASTRRSVASSRVFVLGPSHHVYLTNCALPIMDSYETPIGPLPLDLNGGVYPHSSRVSV